MQRSGQKYRHRSQLRQKLLTRHRLASSEADSSSRPGLTWSRSSGVSSFRRRPILNSHGSAIKAPFASPPSHRGHRVIRFLRSGGTDRRNGLCVSIIQKCLHEFMKRLAKPSFIAERGGAFSAVTTGRALSFRGLSMGETPGPERSRGEQREGAEFPCR
jgi:hypothetical protein